MIDLCNCVCVSDVVIQDSEHVIQGLRRTSRHHLEAVQPFAVAVEYSIQFHSLSP
jgi:hypothetical protein